MARKVHIADGAIVNRAWPERMFDVLSAATVFAWGVAGLYRNRIADGLTLPMVSLICLNVVVVFLFCGRSPVLKIGRWSDVLAVVPSVVSGVILLTRAPEFSAWPRMSAVLFGVAASGAMVSLLCLGKGFGIFPSVRRLSDRGPYRIIRHPVYAFEILMLAVVATTRIDLTNLTVLAVGVMATVGRILLEERLLAGAINYAAYRQQVRWRLLPFVW